MANRKISDLTALTTPATGDLLPIVDISEAAAADKNKKITFGELFASIPAGTAAAPSVAFEGYPGTGIYSSGANQVAISINGTGQLFVDASGNVGVGAAPGTGKKLEVSTASSADGIALSRAGSNRVLLTSDGLIAWGATANQGTLTWDTNQAIIRAAASNSLVFAANNSAEHVRIDTSGRLLVGGSADSGGALLQVFGDRIRIGTAKTPASATATGTTGEIAWDANYIYVCTATDTWKRTAMSTW